MHRLVLLIVLLVTGCASTVDRPTPLPPNALRPLVAVTSFEDRSGFPNSGFRGNWRLQEDMADLLNAELLWSERFEVLERQQLRGVFEELVHQASEYFRPEGKAEHGLLKNVRYQVRGIVDDFTHVAGGSWFLKFRRFFTRGQAQVARVSITLTVVDVESGRIITTAKGSGTATAKSTFMEAHYEDIAFGGDAFHRTPIGHATQQALREAVVRIARAMPLELWRPQVAATTENGIVINGGYERGITLGAVFTVREQAQVITDPQTGDALSHVPGPIVGRVRVVSVDRKVAVAKAIEGSRFQRGQALTNERGPRKPGQ